VGQNRPTPAFPVGEIAHNSRILNQQVAVVFFSVNAYFHPNFSLLAYCSDLFTFLGDFEDFQKSLLSPVTFSKK